MLGVKEFLNKTCSDVIVTILVRSGKEPGCIFRTEEFCLKVFECKKICYGNEVNCFLDGVRVCASTFSQCAQTELVVRKCGCEADRIINKYDRIIFINAGPNIVITASWC
ncbi:hypothetical protein acsn021_32460 [Anaerocolumna cellulosilytica]|uniref:Uncharacterized protein n=1 Tax=Anaerocolumna cellulosilytica TaxID=433286 RepID=A0A6S6R6P4_9FIRM|nr:hypothetical protein [Anaerocolumna cellulosilytica]MBB5196576.1 hypothetical protein [Anaerocolumna cellulosilytica]BCJ95677.1 hypothetical protein acsn021_32460 [Anaerocolumna cellulosilytica]